MAGKLQYWFDNEICQWYIQGMHPDELIAWRKNHGFTQTELGEILGVKKTTVYRWEKNMRIIPSFLHLALECIEMKEDEYREKVMETKMRRRRIGD